MTESLHIAVYHNLHSGGAKHSTYEIVRRLARGHQVDLFCLSTADTDFFDLREFVEESIVFEFKPGRLFRSPFGRLNQAVRWRDLARLERVQRQVTAEIDRRKYDVVYVHPCQFTQSPSLLRYLRTPSLYHSREPLRRFYEPPPPRGYRAERGWRAALDRVDPFNRAYEQRLRQLDRQNICYATRIVTNSFFTREALYRIYGVDARVVYHGVDLETFRPLDLPRENLVLSVGALTPSKGFDFVIESLALMPVHLRPVFVVISNYQEQAERAYLEELASKRGVSLRLRVRVSNDKLVHLYNAARCTVYTPILEPFGLVPLESMACGTPVVAVKEGGVRESVVDGQTGLLLDRDPGQFAAAVRTLIENEKLAERYGKQARAYTLEKWPWERRIEQLEERLVQVAHGSNWKVSNE
jgi:glycosyltransferase involved in cell wall biosynthesis